MQPVIEVDGAYARSRQPKMLKEPGWTKKTKKLSGAAKN